jgi:hypothetical protein
MERIRNINENFSDDKLSSSGDSKRIFSEYNLKVSLFDPFCSFSNQLSLFKRIKVDFCGIHAVSESVNPPPLFTFEYLNQKVR